MDNFGELTMGAKYHASLKKEYSNPDSVANRLKPTNPEDKPDDALSQALLALIESKGQIQQFVDWAEGVGSVNNYNLIAIYRQAICLPPSASQENCDFGLTILGVVARLRLQETFPEPWLLMKDYFDRVLQCSLSSFKSQGKAVSFWWKTTKNMAGLILPAQAVTACMACQGRWADITTEVELVFNSSEVGRQLMEAPMSQVSLEKMSKHIDDHIAKFMAKDTPITTIALDEDRKQWIETMQSSCLDHTKPYQQPKEINCKYRQVCSNVLVTSPLDEYNIKLASAVRSLAVEELVRRRVELAGEVDREEWRNFYSVKIRGGKWTGEHKGVAYDCYACYAINGSLADEFVQSFANVRASVSWSIRAYGDAGAHVLARAWGHKHHYFVMLWAAAGCPEGHIFSEEDIRLYSEPDAFRVLAADAVGPLADRILQIRAMVPK